MEALVNAIEALYNTWSLFPRIYWYKYSKVYAIRLRGSLRKLLRLGGGFPFYVPGIRDVYEDLKTSTDPSF